MARCAQLLDEHIDCTFVDVNMGCPIDLVCDRNAGSALLRCPRRIEEIARAMSRSMALPLTLKTRKGYNDGQDVSETGRPPALLCSPPCLALRPAPRRTAPGHSRGADIPCHAVPCHALCVRMHACCHSYACLGNALRARLRAQRWACCLLCGTAVTRACRCVCLPACMVVQVTHTFVPLIRGWGPQALTLHGRTRQQRYSRSADWDYIRM